MLEGRLGNTCAFRQWQRVYAALGTVVGQSWCLLLRHSRLDKKSRWRQHCTAFGGLLHKVRLDVASFSIVDDEVCVAEVLFFAVLAGQF